MTTITVLICQLDWGYLFLTLSSLEVIFNLFGHLNFSRGPFAAPVSVILCVEITPIFDIKGCHQEQL